MHERTKIQDTASMVLAWLPRQIPNVLRYSSMFIEPGVLHDVVGILGNPITDSTFPFSGLCALRLCVLALNFPLVSRCHLSPLWGFGVLCMPPSYKHIAPLGLNAPTN